MNGGLRCWYVFPIIALLILHQPFRLPAGDEVDPSNIIASGGRRKTRGGQEPRPKYQAKAAVDSDEDEW